MIVHRFYLYSLYHFVSTYFILQSWGFKFISR
jgi:hypothetical protein